jgi:hypothetical protein
MILFGVDFGRVFLGWVTLTNAVREAANFAALNPSAWDTPGNPAAKAEFARLINTEAGEINCVLPDPLPDPTFPSGTDIGSPALVAVTCQFGLITPVISNILGDAIPVSASAAFPIRSGAIAGIPVATGGTLPTIAPPTATPVPTPSPIPTPSPAPTPSPVITAPPMCSVPNLVGTRVKQATKPWTDRGFVANNLIFQPLVGTGNPVITSQSLGANTSVLCSSSMTAFN